ncbi:MAG: PD-(D/E)XK nuclease family protein [Treponema sp.]|jgi:hypothetical protein|nr:PD-(D/E)XK nuclease family protein [Treponema sp.]
MIIADILKREIHKRRVSFVFPSEAAAQRWRLAVLPLGGLRSVAGGRFLAWDTFKETVARDPARDTRRCVTPLLRKLFAEDLARRNHAAATHTGVETAGLPFRCLIPSAYPELGRAYAAEIAAMLPGLKLLREMLRKAGEAAAPDETGDIGALEHLYSAFLDEHGLFEPAWAHQSESAGTEREYYVFFPQTFADFEEYEALLNTAKNIHCVNLPGAPPIPPPIRVYQHYAQELRAAALQLRQAHERGVPWTDMALSVCSLDEYFPYLARELRLYDIPFRRRSGRPLAGQGPGCLFNMIGECAGNNFSFSDMKNLLLCRSIPWDNPRRNMRLIEFGVRYNCVCAWREGGKLHDAWEEAFALASVQETEDWRKAQCETLRKYYVSLRIAVRGMARAKRFADLRAAYFKFRDGFLAVDRCSEADNNILARCIDELSELAALETAYPDLAPEHPFAFFLDVLRKRRYVPQPEKTGVSVYEYENAAAAPFALHLVLNTREGDAQVTRKRCPFLRLHTREALGIEDRDMTEWYFRLYEEGAGIEGSEVLFSAARQGVSGWGVPHSYFAENDTSGAGDAAAPHDAFAPERAWWQKDAAAFPAFLYPAQKQGFEHWAALLRAPDDAAFALFGAGWKALSPAADSLTRKINERRRNDESHPGLLKVSATGDLNVFFECRLKWLFQQIFGIDEYDTSAALHDPQSLGVCYHEALRLLFARIQKDGPFAAHKLPLYEEWLAGCVTAAMQTRPPFKGPLAAPLRASLTAFVTKKLTGVLRAEADRFDGFSVQYLEKELHFMRDNLLVHGVIDRASAAGSECVVLDYKSSAGRYSRAKASVNEDGVIADFQIPMYVRLFETSNAPARVSGAYYLGINNYTLITVVDDRQKVTEKKDHSRAAYQPTLDTFDAFVGRFGEAVSALDFDAAGTKLQACFTCAFRTVCRKTYHLNAGEQQQAAIAEAEASCSGQEDDDD